MADRDKRTQESHIVSALKDALFAALVAFALFALTLGIRTTDSVLGLTLTARPGLLATVVGIVFAGRFVISLFWRRLAKAESKISHVAEATQERDIGRFAGPVLIAAAVLLPLALYAATKLFGVTLPLRYWLDLGILILTYVMLGWGLNIVVGLAGLLDLGYVAFYAVGAYSFALLATTYDLSFWMCLPLAGIFAAFWGILLGFPVLRLRGDYLAIVTLAFGEIIRIVLINWWHVTGGPNGIGNIPRPTLFGLSFQPGEEPNFHSFFGIPFDPLHRILFLYYVILGLALLTNAVTLRLRRLPVGRAWEALREDEIACRSLGVNTTLTKLSAFATGALFGGVAGSFFATRQGFISPESFTFIESATILAIVVLGGMGSQLGVVVASVALIGGFELLRNMQGLRVLFGPEFDPALYRMLIFGGAMVLIMVWKPRGLVSTRLPTVALEQRKAISAEMVHEGRG